jgi:hypothetical protein
MSTLRLVPTSRALREPASRDGLNEDASDLWRRLRGLWLDMDSETRRCLYRQGRELLRSQWARVPDAPRPTSRMERLDRPDGGARVLAGRTLRRRGSPEAG